MKVPLQETPLIDTPFKRCAVDLVGPINPPSEKGHRYILTLVDYATRYPEAVPLKNIDSVTVAEALLDIYSRVGIPEEVITDQGTQFVSDYMKEFSRLIGMKQLPTTPYHAMANGLVEKFNGTLKSMLRKLCTKEPKQWHRLINAALFAYREVPQESTGFSPFELLYGRTIRGPMYILRQLWTKEDTVDEVKTSYQHIIDLRERLDDVMEMALTSLKASQGRYKHYFDKKTKQRDFVPGDQVLILLPTESNKLLMHWQGPFTIEEKVRLNDYKVNVKGKNRTYHANMLKKYHKREVERRPEAVGAVSTFDMASIGIISSENEPESEEREEDMLDLLETKKQKESAKDVLLGEGIENYQKQELKALLEDYYDLFSDLPGNAKGMEHSIQLTSVEPMKSKPYALPYTVRETLKADIDDMLRLGVIRPSVSPYASPTVIVKKPDGTNRICVDYRKLNKMTIFDPEPMTTSADLFRKLSEDRYFSKLDLSKGYWQIPVKDEDIPKTAFVTPDGHYEFLKMPFGMVNSGATLVRAMRKLLGDLQGVDSYIDDILIHTPTWEEHVKLLDEVFKRLKEAGFTVRPSKCRIGETNIEFIGHRLQDGEIRPLEDNIEKIKSSPRPTTQTQVRSFLGLTGYYREFIPHYSTIASPLTDLTKKGQPKKVTWQEAQEKAFNNLKRTLTSAPILRLPDVSKPFVLRTDASDVALGAVLLQEFDGRLFPVSYASRKLLGRERSYSAIEKECLAVVWAVRKYLQYLYGVEFVLQTDHQPLVYINNAKFENNRVMRWAMYLQNFRIKVEAIKGKDNVGADYLSRIDSEFG
jgi:glycerophosphoryl diester phosphodiesterase